LFPQSATIDVSLWFSSPSQTTNSVRFIGIILPLKRAEPCEEPIQLEYKMVLLINKQSLFIKERRKNHKDTKSTKTQLFPARFYSRIASMWNCGENHKDTRRLCYAWRIKADARGQPFLRCRRRRVV